MKTQNKKLNDYSLQQLLKYIILTAQCFGILPIYGITKGHKHLLFRWISLKTIYTYFVVLLQIIYTVIISFFVSIDIKNFFSVVVIVWNVRALLGLIIFLKVAYKWRLLLQQWTEMENMMKDYGAIPSLKRRFNILSFVFLIAGTFEHSIFVYGGTKKVLSIMKNGDNFFRVYFQTLYSEFFNTVSYAHWKAVFIEFLALMTTFLWQFCDLLIILLSSALAERFRQLNQNISTNQLLHEFQWKNVRIKYGKLVVVCNMLNNVAAEMILLSFFGNIYFLSIIIFQTFTLRSAFEAFYFWYDVVFNFAHFILVYYYTAWVYEESQKPLIAIFSVPSRDLNYEVLCFLHQVVAEDVAVSGAGLFKITSSTILDVAMVLITTQLIYFQFKANIPSNIS